VTLHVTVISSPKSPHQFTNRHPYKTITAQSF